MTRRPTGETSALASAALAAIGLAALNLALATSAWGYAYWNDIRHSALLPDSSVTVRIENPSGAGIENYLLYAGGEIVEVPMAGVLDGPSTLEAGAPGPVTGGSRYGFRLLQGGEIDLMPVRLAAGADPEPLDLTRLAEDPAGDQQYSYVNLDLVDCRISFTGERLYAALVNAGGGFPVSSGLTFFGYLLAIADPAQADPDTVFALMQTINQPGIITPGLYKITGTGMGDLHKIGEVVVEEFAALNTLMLSCNLADLTADPYFLSWYDPADPALGVAAFTQRITLLGGAQEADRSPGGDCYLREFAAAAGVNQLPTLSDFALEGSGGGAVAEINYQDADGNCPVLAEIVFDDTLSFDLRPASLDYGTAVTYRTDAGVPPLADDSWTDAVVRFSDDGANWVEYEPCTNGVPEGAGPAGGDLRVCLPSNPCRAPVTIDLVMPTQGHAESEICSKIYDVHGSLVATLAVEALDAGRARAEWNGRDRSGARVRPGVSFCTVSVAGRAATRKLILVD